MDKIAKRIDRQEETSNMKEKEKYSSFGEHVAEKLRYMPPEMVSITQKLISDVIFYGENRNLNMTSRIVTDFPEHLQAPRNASPRLAEPENDQENPLAYYLCNVK